MNPGSGVQGWGIVSVCVPGGGNRPPKKKKIANPQEYVWGGMARGQITEREEKVLLSSKSHRLVGNIK